LLGFDRSTDLSASYRVNIDGRRFEFAVDAGGLTAAQGPSAVTVIASAADLLTTRLGSTEANRKAALRRIKFDGEHDAIDALRTAFSILSNPRGRSTPAGR
jgi:hypothetical protein